jgi:HSP20 family molecular chaperone IbpA
METRMQEPGMLPVRYAPPDLIDEGDHYRIHARLPGFTRENVDVRINIDSMSIRAKKVTEKRTGRRTASTGSVCIQPSGDRYLSPKKPIPPRPGVR